MTFDLKSERERRGKPVPQAPAANAPPPDDPQTKPRRKSAQPADVGDALRTVYQRTIDEQVPPEMLDLLGKLG